MRVFISVCMLAFAVALLGLDQAAAQQPSPDQIAAIKSSCRSDFMSKCWGVPRGGSEAFQCLKKNLASLSAPCAQAVNAAIAAATPKAPSPAPAAAKQDSAPAAPAQATPTTPATPSSEAPKPDTAAATPQSAPQPAPQSPPKAAAKIPEKAAAPAQSTTTEAPASSGSQAKAKASTAVEEPNAGAATKPPAAAPAPQASPTIIGIIPPRKKFMLARSCRDDFRAYCPDVDIGGGRVIICLSENVAKLTPDCRDALAKLVR
jgi:hypothetical protein